eukprot:gene1404-32774_t
MHGLNLGDPTLGAPPCAGRDGLGRERVRVADLTQRVATSRTWTSVRSIKNPFFDFRLGLSASSLALPPPYPDSDKSAIESRVTQVLGRMAFNQLEAVCYCMITSVEEPLADWEEYKLSKLDMDKFIKDRQAPNGPLHGCCDSPSASLARLCSYFEARCDQTTFWIAATCSIHELRIFVGREFAPHGKSVRCSFKDKAFVWESLHAGSPSEADASTRTISFGDNAWEPGPPYAIVKVDLNSAFKMHVGQPLQAIMFPPSDKGPEESKEYLSGVHPTDKCNADLLAKAFPEVHHYLVKRGCGLELGKQRPHYSLVFHFVLYDRGGELARAFCGGESLTDMLRSLDNEAGFHRMTISSWTGNNVSGDEDDGDDGEEEEDRDPPVIDVDACFPRLAEFVAQNRLLQRVDFNTRSGNGSVALVQGKGDSTQCRSPLHWRFDSLFEYLAAADSLLPQLKQVARSKRLADKENKRLAEEKEAGEEEIQQAAALTQPQQRQHAAPLTDSHMWQQAAALTQLQQR